MSSSKGIPCDGRHTCFVHSSMFKDERGVIDVLTTPPGWTVRQIAGPETVKGGIDGNWIRVVLEVKAPPGTQGDLPL